MAVRATTSRKHSKWFRVARSGAFLAMLVSIATDVEARGFGGGRGGGGFRGGGSVSMSRGGSFSRGSGSYGRGSFDRGSSDRSPSISGNYQRSSALDRNSSRRSVDSDLSGYSPGGTFTRSGDYGRPSSRPGQGGSGTEIGQGNRPSTLPGGGGTATQLPARLPGDGGSATQLPANRPGGGADRPIDPGNRPAHPIECRGGCDGSEGWIDHPIAAGIAIGAIAGAAAAIGTTYYELPYGCPPYYWGNAYYYNCDGIWYQPQYEGETIVYVTVPDPSGVQQPPTK